MTNEQEIRCKALELSIQTFALYTDADRSATFEAENNEDKGVTQLVIERAERYLAFITPNPAHADP
jgi:hypothetical protein